jgi:arylsulfatase A-like enzyme
MRPFGSRGVYASDVRLLVQSHVFPAPLVWHSASKGKWHLGNMRTDNTVAENGHPGIQGFDDWLATVRSTQTVNPKFMYDSLISNHRICDNVVGQSAQIMMARAQRFVRQSVADEKPFLAMVWFHEPHVPLYATKVHSDLYNDHPTVAATKRTYWAALSAMDEAIGDLRAELRTLGIEQDTLVWFFSDNGPDHKGGFPGSSGGLSGHKFQVRISTV